jgi:hypothetical protein
MDKKEGPLHVRKVTTEPKSMSDLVPNPSAEGFSEFVRSAKPSELKKSNDFLDGIDDGPVGK